MTGNFIKGTVVGHRVTKLARRVAAISTAGILLQAGGCALDLNTLTTGLLTSITNSLLTDIIFGLLNVSTGGF